jgi:hypothetical protein
MLHSPVPLVLLWGPPGIMLYNGHGVFAGAPSGSWACRCSAPGRKWPTSTATSWRSAWRAARWNTRTGLVLNRRGTPERLDGPLLLPVIAEEGRPGGVIAVVVETTERGWPPHARGAGRALGQMFQHALILAGWKARPCLHRTNAPTAADRPRDVIGGRSAGAAGHRGQGFYELLDRSTAAASACRPCRAGDAAGQPDAPLAAPARLHLPAGAHAAGAVISIFVEGTDVTERERAMAAVRENARRLHRWLGRATASSHDADES